MELIKQEALDILCNKRVLLISLMAQQIKLLKESYKLCDEMDKILPPHPLALYDYLDIIFINFKAMTGESGKQLLPRDVNLLSLGKDKAIEIFTHVLDKAMWQMLFNRLNIYSLMSAKSKVDFNNSLKDKPLPFVIETVCSTLSNILETQDEMLINSLIESILSVSTNYKCNDTFKFTNKVIFNESCHKLHDHFKLNAEGAFKDTITFLSKVIFADKTITKNDKYLNDTYLWRLMTEYFTDNKLDHLDRDEVTFTGGKVVFFNNGNSHLQLNNETVSFLNSELSKTKSLRD